MSRLLSFVLHKKGGSPSPLPDYLNAEFIESSGEQYIDTGIKPTDKTKIEIQFQEVGKYGSWPKVFGTEIAHENKSFKLDTSGSGGYMVIYYMNRNFNISRTSQNTRHTFTLENGAFSFDDYSNTFTYSGDITSDYNIYLCAANRSNSAIEHGAMRIYSCKIYEDDTLVGDFEPRFRTSDNTFGLYNKISNTFFENAGTGKFAGAFPSNLTDGGN